MTTVSPPSCAFSASSCRRLRRRSAPDPKTAIESSSPSKGAQVPPTPSAIPHAPIKKCQFAARTPARLWCRRRCRRRRRRGRAFGGAVVGGGEPYHSPVASGIGRAAVCFAAGGCRLKSSVAGIATDCAGRALDVEAPADDAVGVAVVDVAADRLSEQSCRRSGRADPGGDAERVLARGSRIGSSRSVADRSVSRGRLRAAPPSTVTQRARRLRSAGGDAANGAGAGGVGGVPSGRRTSRPSHRWFR